MFAYIKLLPPDNNFDIVATSQIQKFRLPINTKKHYKVAYEHNFKKALIIFVEETEAALHEKINTERTKVPPAYLQISCTEESDFKTVIPKEKNNQKTIELTSILNKKLALKKQELLIPLRTIYRHDKRKNEDTINNDCSKKIRHNNQVGDLNYVFNFDQVDEDNGETLSSLSLTDDDEESDDTDEVEMNSNFSSNSDSESNQPDENIDDANDNADELDGEDNSQFNDENNVILPRLYENSSLTVDESVLMLLDLYSQNQWVKASLSGTLLMLDKMLPNNNRLPRTIFKLF
ncbi:plasmepsin X-like isoform X3 [Microplitis mediator]|uniref:plasmepsin X-like isoform X3 n=1 Tax=Microplitis mediator TaxID=375433 RepID=UPI0025563543|nr:plasmepsin X-like isoform X3 [Microplitis mediator]